jgi:NAD(P)-dependent dehydrogenase (short-subunit alcohol dehydrogenase family)
VELGLEGKTVIVTGGSSNIGRGIVLGFAKEGARIVNAEIDEEQGQKVVDEANSAGGEAVLIKTDVTDWDLVQAMVRQTLERFGQIDVLVNNAGGTTGMAPFVQKRREEWDKEIKLNYWGVINCTRAVLDHMIERQSGKIVNIASGSGQSGGAAIDCAVYGGTKGAVIALSKALAWELARYGVTVNVASPGWIVPDSPDHTGKGSFWKQWGYDFFTPDKLKRAMKGWPIQRLGRPEDMADTVLFLASDRASFLTGQTISVSGGAIMW